MTDPGAPPFGEDPETAGAVARSLAIAPGSPAGRYVEELGHANAAALPPGACTLDPTTAATRGAWLGLVDRDIADVVATLPSPESSPAWWWCVERAAARLLAAIGDLRAPPGSWPGFEGPAHGLAERCHFLHVALVVAPSTAEFLRRSGVPERFVRASLGDIGRHAAIHRRIHGLTGVEADWWGAVCLRGELVEAGRLQYTRFVVGEDPEPSDPEEVAARSLGYGPGGECLAVHIPEAGPLRPSLVDESLAHAGRLFGHHGGPARRRVATCRSWLLDPQLAAYLPGDSNIVRFQQRFRLLPGGEPGDSDVMDFVFRAPRPGGQPVDLDRLPQHSTMERAAVAHLRAGGHWERRTGWLELPSP